MRLHWNVTAGGTGALPGKYGYTARVSEGTYHIWAPTPGRRKYSLMYSDDSGRGIKAGVVNGLWTDIGLFASPNEAKGAAAAHYKQYFTAARSSGLKMGRRRMGY